MRPRAVNFPTITLAPGTKKRVAYLWSCDAVVRLVDAHVQPGSGAEAGEVDLSILTDDGSTGLIVGEYGPTSCTLAIFANRPKRTPTDTNRRDGIVLSRLVKRGEQWSFDFVNRSANEAIVSLAMIGDFSA